MPASHSSSIRTEVLRHEEMLHADASGFTKALSSQNVRDALVVRVMPRTNFSPARRNPLPTPGVSRDTTALLDARLERRVETAMLSFPEHRRDPRSCSAQIESLRRASPSTSGPLCMHMPPAARAGFIPSVIAGARAHRRELATFDWAFRSIETIARIPPSPDPTP